MMDEADCPICLMPMPDADSQHACVNGHCFCVDCLHSASRNQVSCAYTIPCPLCRVTMDLSQLAESQPTAPEGGIMIRLLIGNTHREVAATHGHNTHEWEAFVDARVCDLTGARMNLLRRSMRVCV